MIPQVVASERGRALKYYKEEWNCLENQSEEGERPVHERITVLFEYGGAGETLSEYSSTIC